MYVTTEVWIDEADLEGFDHAPDLLRLAEAVEALHDEYHVGLVYWCRHAACNDAREALRAARDLAGRHRR